MAALVEISLPNRSRVSEKCRFAFFWMVGRSMTPSLRMAALSLRISDAGFLHGVAGALDHAGDAGLADEHVVSFLGQHEAAGARKRIEAGLRERFQLHLAVAVGEKREHEKREPIGGLLVEGAEHARGVGIAGTALKQRLGLLAAVGAEIFLQQIDHGPEVAAFLHVDLEEVAHVVERGRGLAEVALLLHRGRLGIALDHDQAAEHGAVFARHVLPDRLAAMRAEWDFSPFDRRRQQNAPAVFGHADVVELGPALGVDAHGGAQIHHRLLETFGAHVVPPVDVAGMPALQRALDAQIAAEIDVVGDEAVVIDAGGARCSGYTLSLSKVA